MLQLKTNTCKKNINQTKLTIFETKYNYFVLKLILSSRLCVTATLKTRNQNKEIHCTPKKMPNTREIF